MRSVWKGSVAFGMVTIPVRLYTATQEHDVRFHQVHGADGGRIRYKRVCELDGEEVAYADIDRAVEQPDGSMVTVTKEELDELAVPTGHEIDVIQFVPAEQIDPVLYAKSYYVEPDAKAVKPYELLREALRDTDRIAIGRVAMRQRERLAALRVHEDVIIVQTMLWPDEVREPSFEVLSTDVELRPQEKQMAEQLVESLTSDFDPDAFTDRYAEAVAELVESKAAGATRPPAAEPAAADDGEVTDLVDALRASVERAKAERSGSSPKSDATKSDDAKSDDAKSDDAESGSKSGAGKSRTSKSGAAKSGDADKEEDEKASSSTRRTTRKRSA